MREDEAPKGLIVHSAGEGDQGYYVYDIWESREAFERFMEEKLGPALGEVMGGPPPDGGAPQYFPIDVYESLWAARQPLEMIIARARGAGARGADPRPSEWQLTRRP
jgi:hypothetical protein